MTTALIAQEPAPAADPNAPAGGGSGGFMMMLPILMIAFFLIVLLPQSRRQKREAAAMLANVKRGAKVVTSAGIVGTIVTIKDGEDEVTLRSDDTKLRILRSSIVRVLGQEAASDLARDLLDRVPTSFMLK